MLAHVHGQLPHMVAAGEGELVVPGGGPGVAECGADTGQQFHGAEGLGEVVVGAQIQGTGLVVLRGPG